MRGSWRPNRLKIFWPRLLWPSTLCLSRSPDAQPESLGSTLLGAGFLYCILSATSLVPKIHRVWLSLPHLVYNSVSNRNCNSNSTVWLLSWLSYIIFQRPLDRLLDLWNCMFNRHQAEITVMQFRGHPLPVRQSMRVSFFSLSHFVSQFLPTRFPNCHWNMSLPSGASPWMAFWAGSKVKIQHLLAFSKGQSHTSNISLKQQLIKMYRNYRLRISRIVTDQSMDVWRLSHDNSNS